MRRADSPASRRRRGARHAVARLRDDGEPMRRGSRGLASRRYAAAKGQRLDGPAGATRERRRAPGAVEECEPGRTAQRGDLLARQGDQGGSLQHGRDARAVSTVVELAQRRAAIGVGAIARARPWPPRSRPSRARRRPGSTSPAPAATRHRRRQREVAQVARGRPDQPWRAHAARRRRGEAGGPISSRNCSATSRSVRDRQHRDRAVPREMLDSLRGAAQRLAAKSRRRLACREVDLDLPAALGEHGAADIGQRRPRADRGRTPRARRCAR